MQIAFHLGAHCTDEGGLLRVLLRNRSQLLSEGTGVPDPNRYPVLLQAAASIYAGRAPSPTISEELIDALLPDEAEDAAKRMVLSFEAFLAFQRDAVTESQIYPQAAKRVQGLQRLFEKHPLSLFIAIRNPATFLPALSARRAQKGQEPLPEGFNAYSLRWSELIRRLKAACPTAQLTVWCDEDTPVMVNRVLRSVAGHSEETLLDHALDLPRSLMLPAASKRVATWFQEAQPRTDAEREKALAQFIERYGLADRMQVEFEMPGWSQETVSALSHAYERDCNDIARMEGVTFLRPFA